MFRLKKTKSKSAERTTLSSLKKGELVKNNEKTLNDFLLNLKEFKILEIRDLKKCLDNHRIEKENEFAVLTDFVEKMSRECVLNQHYFSLFDVPDMIVKMAPNKHDYKRMLDLLSCTKQDYLIEKADILKKPIDSVKMTDEDLVPLELIRQVLAQKKHVFRSDCDHIQRLINQSQDEMNQKISQLHVENNKIK